MSRIKKVLGVELVSIMKCPENTNLGKWSSICRKYGFIPTFVSGISHSLDPVSIANKTD